ncbi:DNA-binding response regulator, OmpR family, contains REC and winged-helix (wHTH) domain [Clostridium cadaveris]|uniref:Stage 0 sporulation protein A homolog n=1 Tax=Clostridium cadaveris TaxID=1529 RepID=A0A1I2MF80_9CLOT|nr:response regulator transcription factor [Clostridium cadaveris]MDM8311526.1 response regulator transcription factor [Clostridium cadaveris]NME64855.1 response regulator transcription factor [Clostridium cadaveris]NWK11533.1 response regulator transcription factor [Clostridium cadaveris]SFF90113.1 DNA-binding response regulator, OmpR family, contains REC and winged-helix (wHTH) domain [Clostridium cadaveris]
MSKELNILVVEDDQDINRLINKILMKNGFNVRQAFSGTEARMCLDMFDFQLVILDLMLPGMTGEEIIEEVRKKKNMPIIVISAKTSSEDKVNALKLGADDFVTKPFDALELVARVEAQLRRYTKFSKAEVKKTLKYKEIELDMEEVRVAVRGEELQLTAKEFAILELLMSNPKKVFTRANLFEHVWNDEFWGDDNTVNVHISNLRNKIASIDKENDYIKTVWGIGFKLAE